MTSTILGPILSLVVIYFGITDAIDDHLILYNTAELIIVLGGTIAAGIVIFGIRDLFQVFNIFFRVFLKTRIG